MLLRRITQHVQDQNWFAVFIDFLIVVVGVFIGIQVANWNAAQSDKIQEAAILQQLNDEFTEIKEAIEKQNQLRKNWAMSLKSLIAGLEKSGPIPEDGVIKDALSAARSTGRRPAESAAYLQLTANGDLARLSNENLKQALIQYHTRLERDAFIFPELMRMVVLEMSSNPYVEYDIGARIAVGASIDTDAELEKLRKNEIASYDFEGLRKYEQRYETMSIMHAALLNTDQAQLELVYEILKHVSKEFK